MREATKEDRPVIGTIQTQCVVCWKMFASDSLCEKAKPYARLAEDSGKRGRVAERDDCIDPESLGLMPLERADGIIVWGLRDEEARTELVERMQRARTARNSTVKKTGVIKK